MAIKPTALFTTARKTLITGVTVATAVEATGVITGNLGVYLLSGIALASAVVSGTVTYRVGNTDPPTKSSPTSAPTPPTTGGSHAV